MKGSDVDWFPFASFFSTCQQCHTKVSGGFGHAENKSLGPPVAKEEF